ncbi:signal peptidase I [Nocardioides aromaticivorans]|uniref:Signal peptidase I n=1 Tax=Nocardioides aromaticivorans TaxID=200618 RepID=A0A7Z0CMW4_9ACTN|nr:signal peptidase I [Nocardioides aromaticivorans]NYI44207.1 signal peptidase I [Nocardioides aromaticivorans]
MTHRAEGRRWLRTALGVAALVVFFAAMLVVIAVLAFSVKVSGHSMEPTLADGDRLVVNPFGKDDVARFDIVESTLGDREIPVVKRVIGMPGDRVQASAVGDPPVVRIKPAGEDTVYVVDNPAWSGRVGEKVEPCCADDGTTLPRGKEPAWVTVPDGRFWLLGDNWGGSDDSRTFGFVEQDQVTARISFRVQPFGDFGPVADDVRLVAED